MDLGCGEEIGEGFTFGLPFLDAVFAKETLAGLVSFANGMERVHFAVGLASAGAGITKGTGTGVGDLVI